MRAYGTCGVAGPANYHTPPKLPGSDQKHAIDGHGVYGLDRYTPSDAHGSFGNLHQKTAPTYWTSERIAELREYAAAGLSDEQIGAILGKHMKTVNNARSRYGIERGDLPQ